METRLLPAVIAIITLAGLLYAHKTKNRRLEWLFKPFTSLLFIVTALLSGLDDRYTWLILVGLICGFAGDVLLIPDSVQTFIAGLVIFLFGHVLYIVAFNDVIAFTKLNPLWMLLLAGIAIGVFFMLRPHLGDMQLPVIAYMIVISLMVIAALAVYFESDESRSFRLLVAFGAICFYGSDLGVAIDRFLKPPFKQAYWSLPLYYAGQFMIALSIAEY
ncbi:MAG TPA: lysoplasmalogenase [Aggregatilineales bacterium]|nr:lysoplasmalogenase [Aggregatilineales bacterium]